MSSINEVPSQSVASRFFSSFQPKIHGPLVLVVVGIALAAFIYIRNRNANLKLEQLNATQEKPNITLEVEEVREEFLNWWRQKGNELGKGDYTKLAQKVKNVTKDLPIREMTLHMHHFRLSSNLCYGEIEGENTFTPLDSYEDRTFLPWHSQNEPDATPWWPIKDKSGLYFLPKVTINVVKTRSRSQTAYDYLFELIKSVQVSQARMASGGNALRILEALTPYAEIFAKKLDDNGVLYRKLRAIVPSYPDIAPK